VEQVLRLWGMDLRALGSGKGLFGGMKGFRKILKVSFHHVILQYEPDNEAEKYISLMSANPNSASINGAAFTPSEISALTTVGLLTSSSISSSSSSYFAPPGGNSLMSISNAGSRHAAGSLDAVGGTSATQHIHGGTSLNSIRLTVALYNFSLPNTGTHIKLLVEARNHLLAILKKTKYKEMPVDTLRERWDGGVVAYGEREERKKIRGEFAGVLPGRTKKWKQFYGMRFEWVLEEWAELCE
jgi:hypothetical protein